MWGRCKKNNGRRRKNLFLSPPLSPLPISSLHVCEQCALNWHVCICVRRCDRATAFIACFFFLWERSCFRSSHENCHDGCCMSRRSQVVECRVPLAHSQCCVQFRQSGRDVSRRSSRTMGERRRKGKDGISEKTGAQIDAYLLDGSTSSRSARGTCANGTGKWQ